MAAGTRPPGEYSDLVNPLTGRLQPWFTPRSALALGSHRCFSRNYQSSFQSGHVRVQLICPKEREEQRAGGDRLRDSQEEVFYKAVGRKAPSSGPQTGVGASLTLASQWSHPRLHTGPGTLCLSWKPFVGNFHHLVL